MSTPVWVSAET